MKLESSDLSRFVVIKYNLIALECEYLAKRSQTLRDKKPDVKSRFI